jgi:predicted metalloprotease with PDZ domain
LLALAIFLQLPRSDGGLDLHYDVDLTAATAGSLRVTATIAGDLPSALEVGFPPGVLGQPGDGVQLVGVTAHRTASRGDRRRPLVLERAAAGWRIAGLRGGPIELDYSLALDAVSGRQTDIRSHISARTPSGLRIAGYELFLQPQSQRIDSVTVVFHNPRRLPLVAPWAPAAAGTAEGAITAVAAGARTYAPRGRRDLNNALIATGVALRIETVARGDAVLQLATEHDWLFTDDVWVRLVTRIAAAEIAFFADAPQPLITCLLAPNPVAGPERFDAYGAHTGSSLLVWLGPRTTYADLHDSAASVVAHEMFHGWLGEAIEQRDPDTLWFTEGATSLYAVRQLVAASIWTPEAARGRLSARLERDYWRNPQRDLTSIADAAAQPAADPATVRLAYAGGIAACLALERRLAGEGAPTDPLDGLLRFLYTQRADGPLTRERLVAAILAVTGCDATAWLEAHVYGRETLPTVEPVL